MRVLLLAWLAAAAGGSCPPGPCQCSDEGSLLCSGEGVAQVLRRGVLCGARLLSLQLSRAADLSALPDNLFFRIRGLESIAISDSPLEGVGALLGLERSLEQLSVRGCRLQTLEQLGRLQALRSLDLSNNRLQRPPSPLPPSLQALILRGNRISSLGDSLSGLASLIQLDLSENQLVSVASLPTPHLIFLTLSNNLLREVGEGAFEASGANLRRVDLSGNRLTGLPSGAWASVWGDLHKLDLAGNPIECGLLGDWLRGPEAPRPPENLYGLNCPGIRTHREEEPVLSHGR